jgi:hypothetical protein
MVKHNMLMPYNTLLHVSVRTCGTFSFAFDGILPVYSIKHNAMNLNKFIYSVVYIFDNSLLLSCLRQLNHYVLNPAA